MTYYYESWRNTRNRARLHMMQRTRGGRYMYSTTLRGRKWRPMNDNFYRQLNVRRNWRKIYYHGRR